MLPDNGSPEETEPELIYLGRPCPACDGADDCPVCDGTGETGELVTFEEFRVASSLAGPSWPSLVAG